jgi:hypothetical protein
MRQVSLPSNTILEHFINSSVQMANPGADGEDVPRNPEKRPEILVAKEQVTKEPSLHE